MPTILGYGFRPFYLLAGLYGAAVLPLTVAAMLGHTVIPAAVAAPAFHAHEMVFGYAAAVIAGFLMTAVPNWTQTRAIVGVPLAGLALLWIGGRLAVWLADALPGLTVALIDGAFLPVLAGVQAVVLFRSRNYRNLVVLLIVLGLAAANLAWHGDALGLAPMAAQASPELAIGFLTLLLALLAGRVTPAFTRNALRGVAVRQPGRLDSAGLLLLALVAFLPVVPVPTDVAAALYALAAAVHLARMAGWQTMRALATPLVAILHIGYLWIGVGLALRAVGLAYAPEAAMAGIHAISVGALGVLTLGMMTRSALGHTGRALVTSRTMVAGYVLVNLAAAFRLAAALGVPGYGWFTFASAAFWSAAMILFVIEFLPILTRPRIDGKPG